MYSVTIKYPAKKGDRVLVQNYRRKDRAEWGTVTRIQFTSNFHGDGFYASFDVDLDRKANPNRHGNVLPLSLNVGFDRVLEVERVKSHE